MKAKEWMNQNIPLSKIWAGLKITDEVNYYPFTTVVGMIGQLVVYNMDADCPVIEAEYFHLFDFKTPYEKWGDLVPSGLTVCWNSGYGTIEWERYSAEELLEMTFNRFKVVVDMLNIDDYNASDGYKKNTDLDGHYFEDDQDDLVTTLNYIGKNPKHNFFKLPTLHKS